MSTGQGHHHRFLEQGVDDKVLRLGHGRSQKGCVHLLVSEAYEELRAEALLQCEAHQREGLPERADDTWHEWMKWTGGRNAHAEPALLASRRAPR